MMVDVALREGGKEICFLSQTSLMDNWFDSFPHEGFIYLIGSWKMELMVGGGIW